MEIICGILAFLVIVLIIKNHNNNKYFRSQIENKQKIYNSRSNEWYSERLKLQNENNDLKSKVFDLKDKLDKEFNSNNELREENTSLEKELSEIKLHIDKKKKLPKKPGKSARRDDKIKYTKDYLKANEIKFKEINNTNALLDICDTPFRIYAATQAFINNDTKVKSYGVSEMVKQVKRFVKNNMKGNE